MSSRILAINDDQAILVLYQTVLEEEGYVVSLALMEGQLYSLCRSRALMDLTR